MEEARKENYAALEYVKEFKKRPKRARQERDKWDWTISEAEQYVKENDDSLTSEEKSYYKTPQALNLDELAQQLEIEERGRRP